MSNQASGWQCARCGTRNLASAGLCARCGGARRLRAEVGSPAFAAALSALLPGLGQIYEERWVKGILMLILPAFAFTLAGAFVAYADALTAIVLRYAPFVLFLVVAALLAFHLYVVGDAFAGRLHAFGGRRVGDYAVLGLITFALIGGYAMLYRQSAPWGALAARVFAGFSTHGTTPGGPDDSGPAWTGSDRLNVLVLGVDTRDSDPSTQNTDTMIVMSIDPVNKTAAMLSIPRDIYIDRPGTYQGKVNGAFAFGGPKLAERVVSDLVGVPIHAYSIINFDAFTKIIDGVGGVVVDVRRPLRDESYPTADYGVERLSIAAGPQLMHGDIALKYARSRHDTNDYSRAMRQQIVISALRTKLAQPDAFRTLPSLLDGVGTTVETDFDPANVLPLARSATGIASADIDSEVLYPCGADYPHCELTVSDAGGFFLIPDTAKVRDFAAGVFYDPKIRQEAATVAVENTGAPAGTAREVGDRLARRAYGVTDVTDAETAKSAIVLRDPSKRYTAEQLQRILGNIPIETATQDTGPDVIVRVGSDFRGFAADLSK